MFLMRLVRMLKCDQEEKPPKEHFVDGRGKNQGERKKKNPLRSILWMVGVKTRVNARRKTP